MLKKMLGLGFILVLSGNNSLAANSPPEAENKQLYFPIQPAFVVNINGGNGIVRYAQLAVNVMTTDAEVVGALEYHNAPLRHELIMLFSDMTIHDVASIERREAVREEALVKVRDVLNKYSNLSARQTQNELQSVLFTEFVIQ